MGMTDIRHILAEQKKFFLAGQTKNLEFRLQNLARLRDVIVQNEKYGIRVTEITSRMDRIRSFGI